MGLVMSLIVALGIFSGMYLYLDENVSSANQTIGNNYEGIYSNLTSERNSLNTNIENIRDDVQNITEADSAFQVAINGFKGLGHVLLLPLNFIDSAQNTYRTLLNAVEIPVWSKVLITMALLSTVLFIIIGILRGGTTI